MMAKEQAKTAEDESPITSKQCPFYKLPCLKACALYVKEYDECAIALLAKSVTRYLASKVVQDLLRGRPPKGPTGTIR